MKVSRRGLFGVFLGSMATPALVAAANAGPCLTVNRTIAERLPHTFNRGDAQRAFNYQQSQAVQFGLAGGLRNGDTYTVEGDPRVWTVTKVLKP